MTILADVVPVLSESVSPPLIRGVGDLTAFAYAGNGFAAVAERIGNPEHEAALLFDMAVACQLDFRSAEGLALQHAALARSTLFRIRSDRTIPMALRLLAIVGPGELMANTPLDFITNHLDVRLDLLFILPNQPLPSIVPDHDIAFFAQGDPDPAMLARLSALFAAWPRPALNDPRYLPAMARDTLSRSLAGIPSIRSPTAVAVGRSAVEAHLRDGFIPDGFEREADLYPCLIRPFGSHAGSGLALAMRPADLANYLDTSTGSRFFLTAFEDYADVQGFYRKSRVAFIDRQPFLCHMAASRNWMVHYLNAGMTQSAEKRAWEAEAMATFDQGFARRHAGAFAALHGRLGFDYYSIDCAETRDGRLLVFEADSAAIIHLMDPEDLFPYKPPQMRRVFAAFNDMLVRRSALAAVA